MRSKCKLVGNGDDEVPTIPSIFAVSTFISTTHVLLSIALSFNKKIHTNSTTISSLVITFTSKWQITNKFITFK